VSAAEPKDQREAIPAWVADYVGIPFRSRGRDRFGCDCYGLVAMVLREQFGADVPSYAEEYETATDQEEIAALIDSERRGGVATGAGWRFVYAAQPGDLVLLTIAGRPWHVGILVAPNAMLHTRPGANAVLERLDAPKWKHRIVGYYRYAG
jgi:cell wall-associated NlpC family hydrolase